jgi:hypothetical protein
VIHDLADLLGEGTGEGAAEDGEVLGEHEDQASVDPARARHHAVAQDLPVAQLEVGAAVGLEAVELDEAARVEQQLYSLARRELRLGVLRVDPVLSAAQLGLRVQLLELLELLLDRQFQYSFWAIRAVMAVMLTRSSTEAVGWM